MLRGEAAEGEEVPVDLLFPERLEISILQPGEMFPNESLVYLRPS
jgi:hypothetical protein